jgi:hypothetical protein
MIDFSLTDEQELIREAARDFANNTIKPVATDNDHEGKFDLEIV